VNRQPARLVPTNFDQPIEALLPPKPTKVGAKKKGQADASGVLAAGVIN
jgi:hypothetical protein